MKDTSDHPSFNIRTMTYSKLLLTYFLPPPGRLRDGLIPRMSGRTIHQSLTTHSAGIFPILWWPISVRSAVRVSTDRHSINRMPLRNTRRGSNCDSSTIRQQQALDRQSLILEGSTSSELPSEFGLGKTSDSFECGLQGRKLLFDVPMKHPVHIDNVLEFRI
jgi:hypothetical protein